MTSYLEPDPNVPTLAPVNIYAEDQQPLRDQVDHIYTDISQVVNDKARRNEYLLQEDITNDIWVQTITDPPAAPIPIYRKVIATGALAAGLNQVAHGISQFGTLVDIRIPVTDGTNQRIIPYPSPTPGDCASVVVDTTFVNITLGGTFGGGYTGYILIWYTKL